VHSPLTVNVSLTCSQEQWKIRWEYDDISSEAFSRRRSAFRVHQLSAFGWLLRAVLVLLADDWEL